MPASTTRRRRRRLRALRRRRRERRRRLQRRLRVPGPQARHLLSRFSYGVTPELARDMRRDGGAEAWFRRQLRPERIDDRYADTLRSWFPYLDRSPRELYDISASGRSMGWEILSDFVRWTMLRRTYGNRQVHEVMTEFWSNLLHVPAPSESKTFPNRISYDAAIREHALGRFDELLTAAITHPAMLCYLDNEKSGKENPNENLGRELLELHTVGRAGPDGRDVYGEDDVKDSARILTGWKVDVRGTWRGYYDKSDHHTGRVTVMGFEDANSDPDGRAVTRRYLRYLAHHPATAQRIARRLAVQFVSDDPPADLVAAVRRAYLRSGTAIPATLRALVRHPEFGRSIGAKVRTPGQDLVATLRVLGITAKRPTGRNSDLAHAILHQAEGMGEQPFHWPTPDGPPLANDAWTSVSRMLNSWRAHLNVARGSWPSTAMESRTALQWLPPLPTRFEDAVDHVCRQVLSRPANDAIVDAACLALDMRRRERIARDHRLVRFLLPRLLQTLLDTPQHMTR